MKGSVTLPITLMLYSFLALNLFLGASMGMSSSVPENSFYIVMLRVFSWSSTCYSLEHHLHHE